MLSTTDGQHLDKLDTFLVHSILPVHGPVFINGPESQPRDLL